MFLLSKGQHRLFTNTKPDCYITEGPKPEFESIREESTHPFQYPNTGPAILWGSTAPMNPIRNSNEKKQKRKKLKKMKIWSSVELKLSIIIKTPKPQEIPKRFFYPCLMNRKIREKNRNQQSEIRVPYLFSLTDYRNSPETLPISIDRLIELQNIAIWRTRNRDDERLRTKSRKAGKQKENKRNPNLAYKERSYQTNSEDSSTAPHLCLCCFHGTPGFVKASIGCTVLL